MSFFNTPVVKNLLIINLIVFIAQTITPIGDDLVTWFGLNSWHSDNFMPHQFLTHIFLHGGMAHIFTNMFSLWMFGRILEYDLGSTRFLLYYLVTGIGAGFFNSLVGEFDYSTAQSAVEGFMANPTPNSFSQLIADKFNGMSVSQSFMDAWRQSPENMSYISEAIKGAGEMLTIVTNKVTIGASGAVFGILLAFGLMHPNERIMLLIPPIPIKAKYFVLIYGAIELSLGVTGASSGIAHFAHIGGMIWGAALLYYWKKSGKIYF